MSCYSAYYTIRKSHKKLSIQDIEIELNNMFIDQIPDAIERIIGHFAHERLLKAQTEAEMIEIMKDYGKNRSFNQVMNFISLMGIDFLTEYDKDRAEGGSDTKGIVECLELIKNIGNTDNKLGVCRDAAICQIQLAKHAGIDSC